MHGLGCTHTHMLTDTHPKTSLKNPKQLGNKKWGGNKKLCLNSTCIETSKRKAILLQQRKWAVKPIESLISIPNASDMVGRCCFRGLEWRAGSCHLSAVLRVKAGMAAESRLVYNELDTSQNVYSPNITHFRHPFQLTQDGGKAEFEGVGCVGVCVWGG